MREFPCLFGCEKHLECVYPPCSSSPLNTDHPAPFTSAMTGTPSANTNLDNITTNPGSFSLQPTEDGPGSTAATDISASDEILLLDPTRESSIVICTAESYEEMGQLIETVTEFEGQHRQAHEKHWEETHGTRLLEPVKICEELIAKIFSLQKPKLELLNNQNIIIHYGESPDQGEEEDQSVLEVDEQPDHCEEEEEDKIDLCREALKPYGQLCAAFHELQSCVLYPATRQARCQGLDRDESFERTMNQKLACWSTIVKLIRKDLLEAGEFNAAGETKKTYHIVPGTAQNPFHEYRLRMNPTLPPDLVSDTGTDTE
jgi:hypothetical protein